MVAARRRAARRRARGTRSSPSSSSASGGAHAELLDDVAVLPLPVTGARGRCRARDLPRRRPAVDLTAAARRACRPRSSTASRCSSSTPSSPRTGIAVDAVAATTHKECSHERHRRPARGGRPPRARRRSSPPRRGTRSSSAAGTTASPPPRTWPRPASRCSCSSAASGSAARARSSARSTTTASPSAPARTSSACSTRPSSTSSTSAAAATSATSPTRTCGSRSRTAPRFGQWLDDARTQADLERARRLQGRHRRLLGLRARLRRDPQAAAHRRPRRVAGRLPEPRRDRGAAAAASR